LAFLSAQQAFLQSSAHLSALITSAFSVVQQAFLLQIQQVLVVSLGLRLKLKEIELILI